MSLTHRLSYNASQQALGSILPPSAGVMVHTTAPGFMPEQVMSYKDLHLTASHKNTQQKFPRVF